MPDWKMRVGVHDISVDIDLAISMGHVPGFSFIHAHGLNESVAGTFETVWDLSSAYVYLTTPTLLNISSGDVNDTSAGSGAQEIHIDGLDGGYHPIEEHVATNGQNAVSTVKEYLRVTEIHVTEGAANAGIIYIGTGGPTSGVPDTSYAAISAGYGQSLSAIATIPSGLIGFLYQMELSSGVSKNVIGRLMIRNIDEVFHAHDVLNLIDGKASTTWKYPLRIEQKSDIEIQALAGGAGGSVSASFTILLVKEHSSAVNAIHLSDVDV